MSKGVGKKKKWNLTMAFRDSVVNTAHLSGNGLIWLHWSTSYLKGYGRMQSFCFPTSEHMSRPKDIKKRNRNVFFKRHQKLIQLSVKLVMWVKKINTRLRRILQLGYKNRALYMPVYISFKEYLSFLNFQQKWFCNFSLFWSLSKFQQKWFFKSCEGKLGLRNFIHGFWLKLLVNSNNLVKSPKSR